MELKELFPQGTRLLGDLVFWQLPDQYPKPGDVRAIAGGFEVPDAPSDAEAFKRCLKEAKDKRHDVRIVKDKGGEVVATVSAVKPDEWAETCDYQHASTARLSVNGDATGTPEIVGAYQLARGALGRVEWSAFGVASMMKLSAVKLRERGGFYYVAAPNGQSHPDLATLDRVFQAYGGHLSLVPVYETPKATQTLVRETMTGISADIAELRDEIATFGAKTRDATIADRQAALDALREKSEYVANVLRFNADSFTAEIDTLKVALAGVKDEIPFSSPLAQEHTTPDGEMPEADWI